MEDDVHITDGVPTPIYYLVHACRCKLLRNRAAYRFCAVKNQAYFGFKGHIVIDIHHYVRDFTPIAVSINGRTVLDNMQSLFTDMVIDDKDLLLKNMQDELARYAINLQTLLRKNMPNPRPKALFSLLRIRRRVRIVIGQLTDFLDFDSCNTETI